MTSSTATPTAAEDRAVLARVSKPRLIARRFRRNRLAMTGVVILLVLTVLAIFGPFLSPWDYAEIDFFSLKAPPSAEHWFGTDTAGGDLFALAVHGLGRSLEIGVIAAVLITAIAAFVGAGLAYLGGWGEKIGVWIVDMLLVVPSFLFLCIISSSSGGSTSGWLWLVFAIVIFGWMLYARVVRAVATSLREREYVAAARYMGVRWYVVLWRHMIPNLGSVLIINTVLGVITAIEAETTLSFVGFGITPPDTSLGVLIKEGANSMIGAPWILLIPMTLLLLLLLSMLWINNGLEDALNPSSEAGGKA